MNLVDEIYNKVASYTAISGKRPSNLILSRDNWGRLSTESYPMVRMDSIKNDSLPTFAGMVVSVIPSDIRLFIEVK